MFRTTHNELEKNRSVLMQSFSSVVSNRLAINACQIGGLVCSKSVVRWCQLHCQGRSR